MLTQDPIGLAGGVNLYAYAGNNPIAFSDPYGLCTPIPECLIQLAADWGARRGSGSAASNAVRSATLNVAAAAQVVSDMSGLNRLGEAIGNGDVYNAMREATLIFIPGSSIEAHASQEAAALRGVSWSGQRKAFWRAEARLEGAAETWGEGNVARMKKGLAPQVVNQRTGQLESVELHHTPVPQRDGGIQVVPVTPDQHRAADPYRQ